MSTRFSVQPDGPPCTQCQKSSVIRSLHVVQAAAVEGGDLEADRSALAHQARHVPVVERPAAIENFEWKYGACRVPIG